MSLSPLPGDKMVAPGIAFLARHISVGPRVPVHAGIEIIVNRWVRDSQSDTAGTCPVSRAKFPVGATSVPTRRVAGDYRG
jgi:hypothetical protein